MRANQLNNYNDGVVSFYKKTTEKNVKTMDDLQYLSKLAFAEKTIRQEDVEFAMQQDKKITMKIVTPDDRSMDTSRYALIGDVLYGIIHIDRDRRRSELYFYLQEVRKIDRNR